MEGKLKGRRIVLEPRKGLKQNEYLVEKRGPLGKAFSKHCLVHEIPIPDNGCPECYDNK